MACFCMPRTTASAVTSSSSTTRRVNPGASVTRSPGHDTRPPHTESRAPDPFRRFEFYPAAVSLYESLAERESNPRVVRHAGRQSVKHSEHALLKSGRYARPVVRYRQRAVMADVLRMDGNAPARAVVVFDRVADEIAQHALERRLVRDKRGRIELHRDVKTRRERLNLQNV